MHIRTILSTVLILMLSGLLTVRSNIPPADEVEQVRAFTRQVEFNYITWVADALLLRSSREALGASRFLDTASQKALVSEYLDLTGRQEEISASITRIYASASGPAAEDASRDLRQEQSAAAGRLAEISPAVESILQGQVAAVLAGWDLSVAGQPVPPVWYHSTPLPLALIVSPRGRIETTADISLEAGLAVDQIVALEEWVSGSLDVSALVVPVGGIGVYPTMIMRTTDLTWLADVIAHEWIHNYLTLRPLGLRYEASPQLRTMNETTASIAGKEIGQEVIRRFYPELAPAAPAAAQEVSPPPPDGGKTGSEFIFNQEMHAVRVQVDALLAEGKIDEAEQFMEARRQVFVQQGYAIRKLNQAYFAFYGAYADVPGGAAGQDPVGPAVRALRERSPSLAAFLKEIARMTTFEELQTAVNS